MVKADECGWSSLLLNVKLPQVRKKHGCEGCSPLRQKPGKIREPEREKKRRVAVLGSSWAEHLRNREEMAVGIPMVAGFNRRRQNTPDLGRLALQQSRRFSPPSRYRCVCPKPNSSNEQGSWISTTSWSPDRNKNEEGRKDSCWPPELTKKPGTESAGMNNSYDYSRCDASCWCRRREGRRREVWSRLDRSHGRRTAEGKWSRKVFSR